MLYSQARKAHEEEVLKAFLEAGCKFFPGTKDIALYKGEPLRQKLQEYGHNHLVWYQCCCQNKVTVSCEQEWKNLLEEK